MGSKFKKELWPTLAAYDPHDTSVHDISVLGTHHTLIG